MKHGIGARVAGFTERLDSDRVPRRPRERRGVPPWVWTVLASLGIFGGISSLFVGLVFVVIHGILPADVVFNRFGTGLLIIAIPMILLGSTCLDEIESKK
jgi:hypothetical protein